jgi:membrane protease YdiL (CAAX protease family)
LRALVRRLPPAAEFAFVIVVAFGMSIASAVWFVAAGHRRATMSNADLVGINLYEIVALCVILPMLRTRGWTRRNFEMGPPVAGALRGIALFAASVLAYWGAAIGVRLLTGSWAFAYNVRLESRASLPFIVVTSLINSVFEEVMVVGYVLGALRSRSATVVIVTSALIRLSYHVYQQWLAVVGILPMGLIFASFYWRRWQLWPLIFAHWLGDIVGLVGTSVTT